MSHMDLQTKTIVNYSQIFPRLSGGYIPKTIIMPIKSKDMTAPNYYSNVDKAF